MFDQPNRRLIRRPRFSVPVVLLVLLFLCSAQAARADEIAIWNFNDSDLLVDHGAGTLTTNFNPLNVLFAAGTLTNARLGDLAGQALSLQGGTGNANNGRNITFNVSTVGFAAIVVSFATQGTATGFNSNIELGSGIVVFDPSTTKLSIRLLPVAEVAPLNTMRNAASGLLLRPAMLLKLNTSGEDPKAAGGV